MTKFNCAAVVVIAVPPIFHWLAVKFGLIAVVPSKRSSRLSKFVLILVPQVSSDAPTSGLVNPKVVVVVSAILSRPYAANVQVSAVFETGVHASLVSDCAAHVSAVSD